MNTNSFSNLILVELSLIIITAILVVIALFSHFALLIAISGVLSWLIIGIHLFSLKYED